MNKKIRVAILFGGRSAEHEVSLQSAKSIIDAIDKEKYDVVLIGIDKKGKWLLNDSDSYLIHADNPKLIKLNASNKRLSINPGDEDALSTFDEEYQPDVITVAQRDMETQQKKEGITVVPIEPQTQNLGSVDVIFPVLHGTFGEDGTIQGLFKLLDIPFVGAGVLGSAVGMDKDVMKRLLRDAGIPIARFRAVKKGERVTFDEIQKELGMPCFVKPANLGSSVGVSKVKTKEEFEKAMDDAFLYDQKILFEEYIKGREIECSVLGNENPIASLPGVVIPTHEFYSYDAKYIDEDGAGLKIPADLPEQTIKKVQEMAIQAFRVLCCEGMARVDMFLADDGKLYLNEINTIPGFTKISMYPKLWEATGIPYTELIDRLISLAIARHQVNKRLKTSFT